MMSEGKVLNSSKDSRALRCAAHGRTLFIWPFDLINVILFCRLRWEDCVKRDVRKAGEEEDWKKKTRDRGGWKRLSDEAVKKLRAAPHP